MPSNLWKQFMTAALVAGLPLLAACGDDEEPKPPPPPPTQNAQLRIVHAASDAPAVDIYAEGNATPLFTNVKYGDTTAYGSIPEGTYNVQIRPTGASPSSAPVYSTGPLTLAANAKVSAVAAGLLSSTATADAFRVLPLVESFAAPAEGKVRVRIVHAGADAPAVALDVGDDGSAEVTNLGRFADTGAAGVELPAGTALQVGVLTDSPRARVTAFTLPALPARSEVLVVATGLVAQKARAANGFALLAAKGDGGLGLVRQNPFIYALHASPDAPAVDLFAGERELSDDLSFGELSAPIQVAPGAATVDFFAHAEGSTRPTGTAAASSNTPSLQAGESYLVIASGFLSPTDPEPEFELMPFAESFTPETDKLRLRVVHSSPDAPAVDVSPLDEQGKVPADAAYNDVEYREASAAEGVALPSATLTVGVVAAEATDRTPAATFTLDTASLLGKGLFAVAAGALTPAEDEQPFRLLVVDTSVSPWTVSTLSPQP